MYPWLSLRRLLQALFFFATALPLCLLTIFHVQNYFFQARKNAGSRLHEAAQGIAAAADIDLTLDRKAVLATARALELRDSDDPKQMQLVLRDYHEQFSSFRTMVIADANGKVVAFSAPSANNGSLIGADISDREYFRETMRTQKLFQSSAFRGRGFGSDPIVAFGAPVQLRKGQRYVVEGSLDLTALSQAEAGYRSIAGLAIIIADQKQVVLYASPSLGLAPLDQLKPSAWFSDDPDGAGATGRAKIGSLGDSIVAHHNSPNGWQIYTLRPLKVIDATNHRFYAITVALFVFALIFSMWVGRSLSGLIVDPAERMAESLQAFAETGTATPVELSPFAPHEFWTLGRSFNSMTRRMAKMLTGLLPTCAACKKVRDEKGEWSAMETYIANHTEANFTHSICPDCIRQYYPDVQLPVKPKSQQN